MCLWNFRKDKKELFGDKDEIILYKAVSVRKEEDPDELEDKKRTKYVSPIMKTAIYLGDNTSDRKGTNVTPTEWDNNGIDKGIHVYTYLPSAEQMVSFSSSYNRIILKCVCKKEDYVAHNDTQAVFTKIRLLKQVVS